MVSNCGSFPLKRVDKDREAFYDFQVVGILVGQRVADFLLRSSVKKLRGVGNVLKYGSGLKLRNLSIENSGYRRRGIIEVNW